MILTLHKQTKLEIDMPRFIERILHSYRLEKSPEGRLYYDIYYAVLEITHADIRGYDNSLYAMQALIKNAYTYATENDYSQADINMLEGIIDLL